MLGRLRPLLATVLRAPASLLLKWGIHPNAVTIFGTVGVVASALWFFPQGGRMLFWGVLACAIFSMTDMLDGTMARLSGKTSRLGAFLDSLLDRFADAAIFGGVVVGFHEEDPHTALAALVCMLVGTFVPYARARAEGIGVDAKVGIAERSDRLAFGAIAAAAVGLGAPLWILTWTLWLLSVAGIITVGQRIAAVVKATREDVPAA